MDTVISILIGVPLGIATSLLSWWILVHAISPKDRILTVHFEDATQPRWNGHQMQNSRRRLNIDVEIEARLRVRGMRPDYPENFSNLVILLGVGTGRFPTMPKRPYALILGVRASEVIGTDEHAQPAYLQQKLANQTLTLESVL